MLQQHSWRRGRLASCILALVLTALVCGSASAQVVRRDLRGLDARSATLQSYQRAITAMKNLPPNDPHSWTFQANIHGFPAGSGAADPNWAQCQHASWWFLPWHRAYLYYVERIMRRYSGDAAFALPYWNYADPQARTLPPAFRDPASTLYDATRRQAVNNGSDALSDFIVVQGANQSLANTVFADFDPRVPTFGGPALRQLQHLGMTFGAVENLPHNWVHGFIGGNMSDPNLAARDPIFFTHHANIDRMWEQWLQMGGGRANPADRTWLDQTFTFYDENKQRVSIAVRQVTNLASLGYSYEGLNGQPAQGTQTTGQANVRQVAATRLSQPGRIDSSTTVSLTPTQQTSTVSLQVAQQPLQPTRVFIAVNGVQFAPRPDSALAVFVNLPPNGRTVSPADRHFAGYVSFFGHADHAHEGQPAHVGESCTLDITPTVIRLHQRGEWNWNETTVTLERVCPGSRPSPATAVVTFQGVSLLAQTE